MEFSIVSLAFLLGCGVVLAQQHLTKPEEASGTTAQQASAHQAAALPAASKARPTRSLSFEEKLEKRVPRYDPARRTIFASVLDLIYEYGLPAGIEYADRDSVSRPVSLKFHNQPVRGILGALIQQDPELRVSFSDGLVNIFSPKARQDSSSVLNKVIKDFDAGGQDAVHAGFAVFCASHDGGVCAGSLAGGQLGPRKITVHLQNATVHELLSAIVAQNGKAFWAVMAPPPTSDDYWHMYPLQRAFETTVLDQLIRAGTH